MEDWKIGSMEEWKIKFSLISIQGRTGKSSRGLVLEVPDISPLNQRNKIVAGKIGLFRDEEAH
jgi:hypothetical protein